METTAYGTEGRRPPIIIPPTSAPPDISKHAAFIFIHGLGDQAEGVENIARQFQAAGKLPHMTWVLPNAPEIHDLATTAWYMPTRLSPYPPSRPELEEDEDEQGMMATVAYITTLIDDLHLQGISKNRIVLGGFSQGHAMALLTGLVSVHAGSLGGLVGLSGYLPIPDRIPILREQMQVPVGDHREVPVFLARGTGDRRVPGRYHRMCYEALYELGVRKEDVTIREYEGMGHSMCGEELRDICMWLEGVLPAL